MKDYQFLNIIYLEVITMADSILRDKANEFAKKTVFLWRMAEFTSLNCISTLKIKIKKSQLPFMELRFFILYLFLTAFLKAYP